MDKRIVITGMGIICGIGKNKTEVMESIKTCRTGIRPIRKFDVSMYDCRYGCEVADYNEKFFFSAETLKYANLCSQFGLLAVEEAVEQSKIDFSCVDPHDVGVCVGSSHGALDVIYDFYRKVHANAYEDIDHLYLFRKLHASIIKVIAHKYRINGMVSMISTACASGSNAMGMALDWIRSGKSKYVITGGSDVLDQALHAGFWALKAVSNAPCSPFSGRPGISLGEGAAFFILEDIKTAQKRNAPILAEVLGYGLSGDAYHATSPEPRGKGAKLAVARAIEDAGIEKKEIEYVNAHGTGTVGNDAMEAIMHTSFFGDLGPQIPLSSTKSYFGHATGAAGSLEICVAVMCMNQNILPPTLNFSKPRHSHPIDYIPNELLHKRTDLFLNCNYGFAGNNSANVIGRYKANRKIPATKKEKRRVAITGIGVVTPIGVGVKEFGEALNAGTHSVSKITRFNTSNYSGSHACFIENFKPGKYDRKINANQRMDLVSQYSTTAASLCLQDAGVSKNRKVRSEIGIIMGVSSAPRRGIDRHLMKMIENGPTFPSSAYFPYSTQNSALGHVNVTLGLMGQTSNLHVDGCSGLNSLIYGQTMVQSGRTDKIIIGGGDEVFWSYFEELSLLEELSAKDSPIDLFTEKDQGYHPGEGGVFMMLESFEAAKKQNADIYAEIMGSFITSDSNSDLHLNDPSGKGLIKAMEMALYEADIDASKIGWISCTERGLASVKQAETRAIDHFWGDVLEDIVIINTIPYIGWMDSVSSLMNLTATILSARKNKHLARGYKFDVASKYAAALTNLKPAPGKPFGACLGVAREGYNYAVIINPVERNFYTE
jgi:3-oxoacyl-[acyl-carrier-protein] synthase II